MVMGRDSHSKRRGFKSQYRILDGHFFTYICCKNRNFCLKRLKINKKRPGLAHFLKKLTSFLICLDSAALLILNEQQFYLFGQFQTSPTRGQPYGDASQYGECFSA